MHEVRAVAPENVRSGLDDLAGEVAKAGVGCVRMFGPRWIEKITSVA
jgi:hypothetical protein